MRKSLVVLGVVVAALLLTTSAFAQSRGVTFTPVGFIDPPGPFPASSVLAMNPQGTVFVASPDYRSGFGVLWTREGGWGDLIGSFAPPVRLSAEGTVMSSGIYPGSNPAYAWPGTWLGTQDVWEPITPDPDYAPCGSSRMSFYDMGGDGDYAVGLTWAGCAAARGFLWDKATNTSINLGTPNGQSTRANAVTSDGSAVIGWGTSLGGSRRGARWEDGTWTFYGDPTGQEPKACKVTPKGCTSDSADPVRGCPEYVDDGSCPASSKGVCTAGVCVGGFDAGKTCTSSSQCGGTCAGGPNNGKRCTSNGSCPDTPVCLANPLWSDDLWKGEAFDVTPDGAHAVGRNFDYATGWDSGWRSNPDGSFDQIPVIPDFPYIINPAAISDNSHIVVGSAGSFFSGYAPFIWNKDLGTLDFQLFLIGQGLDELYFWYLTQITSVSANGRVVAGVGINPDNLQEGWVVDIRQVLVCVIADPETGEAKLDDSEANSDCVDGVGPGCRTMRVDYEVVGDPSNLGSCEFKRGGGLARAQALRQELTEKYQSGAFNSVYKFKRNLENGPLETRQFGSVTR
ncbi:MAG: hypothetical protein MUC67_00950 [Acidobacteria bacterium]|nr:hypothetical protein [Acidobacteriota bacterium]